MHNKKRIALVTLVVFLCTIVLPTGAAWAEDPAPAPTIPNVTVTPDFTKDSAGQLVVEAGSSQVVKVEVASYVANAGKALDLAMTFPKGLVPDGGSGQTHTEKSLPTDGKNYTVNVKVPTVVGEYKDQSITWKIGGNNGSQPITYIVTASALNWEKPASRNNSTLTVTKENFAGDTEPLHGSMNINLKDEYGNNTSRIVEGQSLYVWIEDGLNSKLGTIIADADGAASGCTVKQIGSSKFYEITNLKSSLLTLSYTIDSPGGDYTVNVAQGASGLTNTMTIKGLASKKSVNVNMKLAQLSITDYGQVTTRPDANAIIKVTLVNTPGEDVYLRLPEGFVTDRAEKTITDPVTGKTVRLVPIQEGANDLVIKQVPNEGVREYTDFWLYLGEEQYRPVKCIGSITVHVSGIQASIKNFLDFRHGSQDRTEVAPEVQFVFTDLSTQGSPFYIDFPQKTKNGAPSPLMPNMTYQEITTGGMVYWRVQPTVIVSDKSKTTPVSVPVKKNPAAPNFIHDNTYDETITIGLSSLFNGKEYEKGQIDLRYRITDKVINPSQSAIAPVTEQKEVFIDGVMHYQTTTELTLDSEILNGRNLYIWVESTDGRLTAKDRFNITTSDQRIQLTNTFLGSAEGSATGSNNIYTITNKGEKLSEELLVWENIPLTITSAQPGTYVIKIAVGGNAADAYADTANHKKSDPFTLVDKNKIPVVIVENVDKIYGRTDGETAGTVYGQVKFTIKNFKLENNQSGKLTIQLDPTTTSSSMLEVTFSDNQKVSNGDYVVIADVTDPPSFADAKLTVPITSGKFEVGASAEEMSALSRVDWSGELLFEKRPEVAVAWSEGEGFSSGRIVVGETGKAIVTLKPASNMDAAVLTGKGLHLWLSDGNIMQGNYLEGENLSPAIGESNAGKYFLPASAIENGAFTAEITVKGLPAGSYTLMAQAVNADDQAVVPNCASAGFSFEVTPGAEDIWHLAVAVNGNNLNADDTGLFTSQSLPVNQPISVKATITKGSTPMSNVNVRLTGEESQGAAVSAGELMTDESGSVIFTITPKADTEANYTFQITAVSEGTEQVRGNLKLPVVKEIDPDEPSGDGTEGELEIKAITARVAVGDRASVYLEVYDKHDDLIKVTSNSMARNLIDRVYFDNTPSNSDNTSGDISIQRLGDGIEISFRPDYRGNYSMVIIGKNNTLRPDIYAVRQGEIVRMELKYAESALGLGKTSSMPIITTYDADDVWAERTLQSSSRLDFYTTGGAVETSDELGRVTVKDMDRYIGTTITAVVTDERAGLIAEYVFDVVRGNSTSSDNDYNNDNNFLNQKQVVMWDTYGAVGASNRFNFYLMGENGFRANLESGQMSSSMGASATVSVAGRPSGAIVSASIHDNGRTLEHGGDGLLYVSCDKEGTVKLNITVKVYNPDKSTGYYNRYDYYRGTVSLQFTDNAPVQWGNSSGSSSSWGSGSNSSSNPSSSVSVAMFVGSTRYTVNMASRNMEAAPYLSNGRIYLPLRTLSDSIGAGIFFDNNTQQITIIYDSERVVMQVGSNTVTTTRGGTYRVDGTPEIVDGRTFVPLRVVGEALQMRVTTVTDVNGKIVGAVLSK